MNAEDLRIAIGRALAWLLIGAGVVSLAALSTCAQAAEPVHVDALVVFDGVETHLPAAICVLDEPLAYQREDGRLTLRLAGVTCADRLFGDGFDAPARVQAWREPR